MVFFSQNVGACWRETAGGWNENHNYIYGHMFEILYEKSLRNFKFSLGRGGGGTENDNEEEVI